MTETRMQATETHSLGGEEVVLAHTVLLPTSSLAFLLYYHAPLQKPNPILRTFQTQL